MTTAAIEFQDCERKTPPQHYPVTFIDVKPSGIDFKFMRGVDPRSQKTQVYTVTMTPATGAGTWQGPEGETGDIEHVKQQKQPEGYTVEGIWVEAGERRIMLLEYV